MFVSAHGNIFVDNMAYLPSSLSLVPIGNTPDPYKQVFSYRTVYRRNHPQVSWNYGDKHPLPRQQDKQPMGCWRYCPHTCQWLDSLRSKSKQNDSIIKVTQKKWQIEFRRTCSSDTRKLLLLLFICTRTSWSTVVQDSAPKINTQRFSITNEVNQDSCSVSETLLRPATDQRINRAPTHDRHSM